MYEDYYLEKAYRLVKDKVESDLSRKKLLTKDTTVLPEFEVKAVLFGKTLQNWKGLFITDLPIEMYYEVTYNGDKEETYIDAYEKIDNVCIKDNA